MVNLIRLRLLLHLVHIEGALMLSPCPLTLAVSVAGCNGSFLRRPIAGAYITPEELPGNVLHSLLTHFTVLVTQFAFPLNYGP
ncbi:hypothetical protein PF011_g20573 [Phytophthora fragariae]|uniref:Secreted protein n=1 Tax=Phytophthora fragariae TaxID=53985 RepID=A0A6A3ISY3_9STRA|nr:hypothetical protein PF011_g20573 [Phytophthora fragariae]